MREEQHDWRVDAALLGLICIIAITLGLVAHKMTTSQTANQSTITRYCANTQGFQLMPDVEADEDGPYSYAPCKFMKLEQDV